MNVGNIKSNLYVEISNNLSLYKFDLPIMHPHGRHLAFSFTVNMFKRKGLKERLKRGRTSHLLFCIYYGFVSYLETFLMIIYYEKVIGTFFFILIILKTFFF